MFLFISLPNKIAPHQLQKGLLPLLLLPSHLTPPSSPLQGLAVSGGQGGRRPSQVWDCRAGPSTSPTSLTLALLPDLGRGALCRVGVGEPTVLSSGTWSSTLQWEGPWRGQEKVIKNLDCSRLL